jgi:hypothetical protein
MSKPKRKTYRVTGPHAVDGNAPGTEYQAAYSAAHEQYLITAGHVEIVDVTATTKSKET